MAIFVSGSSIAVVLNLPTALNLSCDDLQP